MDVGHILATRFKDIDTPVLIPVLASPHAGALAAILIPVLVASASPWRPCATCGYGSKPVATMLPVATVMQPPGSRRPSPQPSLSPALRAARRGWWLTPLQRGWAATTSARVFDVLVRSPRPARLRRAQARVVALILKARQPFFFIGSTRLRPSRIRSTATKKQKQTPLQPQQHCRASRGHPPHFHHTIVHGLLSGY